MHAKAELTSSRLCLGGLEAMVVLIIVSVGIVKNFMRARLLRFLSMLAD